MNSQLISMRLSLCAMLLCIVGCASVPKPTQVPYDRTWPEWNRVLAHFVHPDGIDYATLAGRRAELDEAITAFQAVRPETFKAWPEHDRLAYLINVHNAYAMKRIVDHWPVRSMGWTQPFWFAQRVRDIPAVGKMWSLKSLRREIMGDNFVEARAIFLLNWGARGCAPLQPVAVTELNLRDLLDRQAKRIMADPLYADYRPTDYEIYLTPLIKYYKRDFIRDFATQWIFLQKYMPAEAAKQIKKRPPRIHWMSFDDDLNDVQPQRIAATTKSAEQETKQE